MSIFTLFASDGSSISLDAVTDITRTRSATTTTSTIFNGSSISDHYKAGLPMWSVQGVVVATKSRVSNSLHDPQKFRMLMDQYMDSETRFRYVDSNQDLSFGNAKDVVILDYSITRNAKYGDSLLVSLSLQQLDISTSVQKTTITNPNSANDGTLSEPESRAPNGKTTENSKVLQSTFARETGQSISELFSQTNE